MISLEKWKILTPLQNLPGCEHNRIETQVVEVGDKKFDHYDLSCNPNIFVYTNFYTIVEIVGRLRQGSNSFEK